MTFPVAIVIVSLIGIAILFTWLFSRNRTTDRTRLLRGRWFGGGFEELEDRVMPSVYGTLNTLDTDLLIPSLAASDQVRVEISSNTSVDTFKLNSGQMAGDLELSFLDNFTPTLGQSYKVLTATEPLTDNFAHYTGLPQHEDGFLALRVSVTCWREAHALDDEAALLENADGRPITGGGVGDQRPFGDFQQQQLQRSAGDPHPPVRSVDPVPNVILAVHREAGDGPNQLLADENDPGDVPRIVQHFRPMCVERLKGSWDRDRQAVRFRVELQFVDVGQVARLNRTEPNTLIGGHGRTPSTE
jgi:hypothetical protein